MSPAAHALLVTCAAHLFSVLSAEAPLDAGHRLEGSFWNGFEDELIDDRLAEGELLVQSEADKVPQIRSSGQNAPDHAVATFEVSAAAVAEVGPRALNLAVEAFEASRQRDTETYAKLTNPNHVGPRSLNAAIASFEDTHPRARHKLPTEVGGDAHFAFGPRGLNAAIADFEKTHPRASELPAEEADRADVSGPRSLNAAIADFDANHPHTANDIPSGVEADVASVVGPRGINNAIADFEATHLRFNEVPLPTASQSYNVETKASADGPSVFGPRSLNAVVANFEAGHPRATRTVDADARKTGEQPWTARDMFRFCVQVALAGAALRAVFSMVQGVVAQGWGSGPMGKEKAAI